MRARIFLVMLLAAVFTACGSAPAPTAAPARAGVVSLAPHLTEVVFALGQGHRVTGVGRYDDWPPEIAALPRVGGYLDPDLEAITKLSPEVLLLPGQHKKVSEYAALQQIPVLNIHMDSFETIFAGIRALGDALGCAPEAEKLVAALETERKAIASAVAAFPRKKALIITRRDSHNLNTLYTTGGASFVSEIVALAGGDNIYADNAQPYFEASKETVVAAAPEAIVEFHAGENLDPAGQQAFIADWQALPTLPAVAEGRILLVLESHSLRPGPRVLEIARNIARALHPGLEIPDAPSD